MVPREAGVCPDVVAVFNFEFVICVSSLHNFKDPEQGVKEMKRVGKKFVITILKKAKNAETLAAMIKKNFKVTKFVEDKHDYIYFCE